MILIAAYQGKSFVSRLIRWFTRSKYSHIGILFTESLVVKRPGGRVDILAAGNVIEAWQGGVRLSASLSAVHEPGTVVDLFSFKDQALRSHEQQQLFAHFLCAQLGKSYDYLAIVRFLTRAPANRWNKQKWFCSELAFEAFLTAGHELLERCAAWEIAPRDIPRSPLLKFEKTIVTTKGIL